MDIFQDPWPNEKLLTCNRLNHIQLLPFSWSCSFLLRQTHGGWDWGWPRGRGSQMKTRRRSSWGQFTWQAPSPPPPHVRLETCCHVSVTHPGQTGSTRVTSLLCASWSPTESLMFTHRGGSCAPDVMVVMCDVWCVVMCDVLPPSCVIPDPHLSC